MWLILPEHLDYGLDWDKARYSSHEDVAKIRAKCMAVDSLLDDEVESILDELGDIESHTWLIKYNDYIIERGHGTVVHVKLVETLDNEEPADGE